MITIAISTLQNRKKEVVTSLTIANGDVILILRDNKGNISREVIKCGQHMK